MKKEEQTEEVMLELYKLTKMFTKTLQPRYYYQFQGDVDDLASEFFVQFITPKGRKGSEKESLLDKFNPQTTSLPYLVKVCVIRKLIDQSRQHPQRFISFEALFEDKGDTFINIIISSKDEVSTRISDPKFRKLIVDGFRKLPEDQKNKLFVELFDSGSDLAKYLDPSTKYVRTCPVQQVTTKTVVLYIPQSHKLVNFSLDDGHPRGPFQPFHLSESELISLREMGEYHSQFSRELFAEYLESSYSRAVI